MIEYHTDTCPGSSGAWVFPFFPGSKKGAYVPRACDATIGDQCTAVPQAKLTTATVWTRRLNISRKGKK